MPPLVGSLLSLRISWRFGAVHRVVGRHFSNKPMAEYKGIVLGIYWDKNKETVFTAATEKYDKTISGGLSRILPIACSTLKKGKNRILYGLDQEYNAIAVVNLGNTDAGYNDLEEVDEKREQVRIAVAGGVRQLREVGATAIDVDPCDDGEAAGEGSTLSLFCFDELKRSCSRKPACEVNLLPGQSSNIIADWKKGVIKAEGQNLARRLMESPANLMTPTRFAQIAIETLTEKGVNVVARNKEWALEQKMGSFLSVAKGSDEPLVFLEMSYSGNKEGDVTPVVFVGKGITFDSGGISLKPSANMDKMRADMGGAACVVASIYTAAALQLPVNVIGLTPLCENMPSGRASKPGDVVTAMNGKTIQIDNTDAEGRLILADALCYAHTFQPTAIIDLATLTGAMSVALGAAVTGVFTNSSILWELLHESGKTTGDRVWRMPLFNHYKQQVTECHLADINNIGTDRAGGACTAAAFLKEFVTTSHWAHMDIAGVMENKDAVPYLCSGLAGRPTRTMVEFLSRYCTQKPF